MADFDEIREKVNKLQGLLKSEVVDVDLLKCLPGMLPIAYQGMIYAVKTKKPADPAYKDFQTLEFKISLPANQCMNWNSVHICFPIQIKKSMAVPNDINANMVTVNKCFVRWI